MYRKDKPLTLKGSASSMCNNLTIHVSSEKNQITYAIVHKAVANIVSTNIDGTCPNHRQLLCKEPSTSGQAGVGFWNPILIQAKFLQVGSRMILVVTSQKAIQMYEGESSALFYWHALGDPQATDTPTFSRGICHIEGTNTVCVGTFEGHILVFNIPPKGTDVTLAEKLKGHKYPICDITSHNDNLVSSDDQGNIRVWQARADKFSTRAQISGSGYPCSSLAVYSDIIAAGYGDGHLRIFNLSTGKMSAEIAAHARWVTAIDISSRGQLLSVGEDSFVHVWQLNHNGALLEVEHTFSESVSDLQLVGGRFVSPDGRAFCVTGYDSNELIFFRN
ncbi:WD repeat-containing protein 54-like [Lineus longissimus]|uniref:WD repeat-containing protein 54-like n=1 Tax=Lineus longissimus TaxID=88925 RepID=UPI002B4CCA6F